MKPYEYHRDPFFWLLFVIAALVLIFGSRCSEKPDIYEEKFMVSFSTNTSFRAFVFLFGDEELNPTIGLIYSRYDGRYIGSFWKTDSTWTIEKANGETRSFDPYMAIPRMKLFKKKRAPPRKEEEDENERFTGTGQYSDSGWLS